MFRISTTYRYGILPLQAHLPVAVLWRKMTTPLTVVALLATLVALDTAQLSRKLRTLNGQDRELYSVGIPVHLTADGLLLHTLPSLNGVSRGSSISQPNPKCFHVHTAKNRCMYFASCDVSVSACTDICTSVTVNMYNHLRVLILANCR